MAVVSVKVLSLPGEASFGGGDNLSISLLVRCDDPSDGPYTVLSVVGNPLPGPDIIPARGTPYNWGNDQNGSSRCDNLQVAPRRSRSTAPNANEFIEYIVTANYLRPNSDAGGGGGGGSGSAGGGGGYTGKGMKPDGDWAEDPADVDIKVTPGYRIISKPIRRAEFIGYTDQDGTAFTPSTLGNPEGNPLMPANTEQPVWSSTQEQFLPLPEIEIGVPTVTHGAFYESWDNTWDNAIQKVNDANFTIDFKDYSNLDVYVRTFAADTLLLNNIQATQTQFGTTVWYWVSFEFWVNPDGWFESFLDEGTRQVLEASASKYGRTTWAPITAARGGTITAPVQMDGTGRPLSDEHQNTVIEQVYLKYRLKAQYDFSLIGLKQ